MSMPACRSLIGSICRRHGRRTPFDARKAGVPDDITFQTKAEIALGTDPRRPGGGRRRPPPCWPTQATASIPTSVTGVTALGLPYVVGIQSSTSLWAPGTATIAAEALARHWPSTLADPPRRQAQAGVRQANGTRTAEAVMAASDVAGRHQRQAHVTLCRRARPTGASRLQSHQPETRGMVFDRMARKRSRADQILAHHPTS